jgi:hypothetical protein
MKDGAMEIHYRMRFWKSLAEIVEAAKPLIISAIKDQIRSNKEKSH